MKRRPIIIAGPCVIEGERPLLETAGFVSKFIPRKDIELFFKASFDKANRSSINSYRGVGLDNGIALLKSIKDRFGLRILTDIHERYQIEKIAEIADIIQIPAFLSRQTDLIVESAKTGKMVNIKKGQFMSPREALLAYEKARRFTENRIFITERGSTFGYSDLVVDFRTAEFLMEEGVEVIMDITHSCQRPAGKAGSSGGDKRYSFTFAKIAGAMGLSGMFAEIHPLPEKALSDSSTQLDFTEYKRALKLFLKHYSIA